MSTTATRTICHCIGGKQTPGEASRPSPVYAPATGEVQAEVLLAEQADVDAAVGAARSAADNWAEVSLSRRAKIMFAFRELVNANLDEITRIVSSEHGKVLADAKG